MEHVVETDCPFTSESGYEENAGKVLYAFEAEPGDAIRLTKYIVYYSSEWASIGELRDRATITLSRGVRRGMSEMLAEQRAYMDDFAGLAFGAFHHFIYRPFKSGLLKRPLKRGLALSQAAAAALFSYRELKVAATDANGSGLLRGLFAPLALVASRLSALSSQLRSGRYGSADIDATETSLAEIGSASSAAGMPIRDQLVPGGL